MPEYWASKAAFEWWKSLQEETRQDIEQGRGPDAIDIYEAGILYGWDNPQWIPVDKGLPEHNEEKNGLISYPIVLVCLYDGYRTEDSYDDIHGKWLDYDGEVEYWMPMPLAPKNKD